MRALCLLALIALPPCAAAGSKLDVNDAWIRSAPPGTAMLAGYAILHNTGDAPVVVRGASSDAFAAVSMHESIESGGVEHMRPLEEITIAPHARVMLAPGGKHLMLMRPTRPLAAGASLKIHFATNDAAGADAEFVVRDEAPR
jgi:hypothetical protein